MNTYFWLIALILFAVVEACTAGLVSIWFAVGALFALIAAALHAAPWLQITVFLVASIISLILTRRAVSSRLLKTTPTNTDMLIGEVGVCEEEINNLKELGSVRIKGKVWSARSKNGDIIPADSVVRVLEIQGVKLIVELSQ